MWLQSYRQRYIQKLVILSIMLVLILVLSKFNFGEDRVLLSESHIQVEVVSIAAPGNPKSIRQVGGNLNPVTVALPDGKHAVVPFKYSQPSIGDLVEVKLQQFDGGKQRVVAAEF